MKKRYLAVSVLLVLATLAATVILYRHLPATIPIHWDMHGQANGYGPRGFIFMHVALMAAIIGLWGLLPALSPKRFAVESFHDTYWYCCLVVVALVAYVQAVMLWGAASGSVDTGRALQAGLAIFMALLGNVMGKVRRNFWIGIRTPWTLANERVWYATHRLAGKAMVVAGLLALAAVLARLPDAVCFGLLGLGLLVPLVYSLVYYKRLEHGGQLEG